MTTIRELLRGAGGLSGEDARRDAETLLGYCLGRSRAWLYTWPEADVEPELAQSYRALLDRRREGFPVAYLTGEREFWTLSLAVNEQTLIPRPETETLVEWALELPLPENSSVADLGTGSGAIALALASERRGWEITAVDSSAAAVELATLNAMRNGLERVDCRMSDWYDQLGNDRFNLLVSNPPYVAPDDHHLDAGDLRYEPREALVAEQDGMAALARIIAGAPEHLQPAGWLLLEHGWTQGAAVRARLAEAGFDRVATRCDLAGLERVTGGCRRAD